eukprot:3394739-Rhodomonas_salina.2
MELSAYAGAMRSVALTDPVVLSAYALAVRYPYATRPGTDGAYGARRGRSGGARGRQVPLASCALATRCPVLTYRMILPDAKSHDPWRASRKEG